jgi:uncharacterized integral membrane protein
MTDTEMPAENVETTRPTPEAPSAEPARRPDAPTAHPLAHTRTSGYWAAVVIGLLVLLVLLVFILENGQTARVTFFGAHGHLPQGVALLFAAVIGGLFVVLAGAARILQLRSRVQGHVLPRHGGRRTKKATPHRAEHEITEPPAPSPPSD